MNGDIGMTYVCDHCGKELFRKAIAGNYIITEDGVYHKDTDYEKLPGGWMSKDGCHVCPDCMKRIKYQLNHLDDEPKTKKLRARLGATLDLTEAQYNDIMNAENDQDTAFKAFKAVIDAGCFKIDGDCYIPGEDAIGDIAEFNI